MIELQSLLKEAVDKMASDIFISVGVPPTLKINGQLIKVDDEKLNPETAKKMISELFKTEEDFLDFVKAGEKDFSTSLAGIGRFRVAAYIQRGSMAAAIRVLRFESLDLGQLNIPTEILDFHSKKKGLILVTGPTGSGKSTTLSAIISLINKKRSCHILTLEDPIEYLHKHDKSIVDQREIGIDTKSYSMALKSALRQAPDVILIGEMRDYETVSIALTAAETGHLVLSTLHTTSAAKTIDRIIDVFEPSQQQQIRVQLSTVLTAVVTQQLLPSIDDSRIPAFEVMIANPNIRNLIREAKIPQIDAAIQTGRAFGMMSMDMSIANLYNEGKITKETALAYAVNPEGITKYFK
ncbi:MULTISPECIES: type IV pilus twitching motility protein PilT [Acetoanaerobium]|uniref:Twitching mobility protein n=1 Tax=Acetoanaerobium sticklandii (strain ATCC 12662 / DSM 519 / JCM 1433 / CCUG 9281 / NCIMB 10654 / HF) TaxID=499177 RepID=E3PX21_ACESD|nr:MULTISPECIES: PilT/PilU family type 4a pilus ATPase [Acetoanaerobium]MBP8763729.1 PilT/PilU family type 4a pilus ATPase [Acetoanaerobium sp.]MBP9562450.1 PilT/PilU family type 4a pilus ATPase [Acetoanaerobium sp.]CBH20986.1 Twitching mobility protein [Acetoanaerobium sticklandii]